MLVYGGLFTKKNDQKKKIMPLHFLSKSILWEIRIESVTEKKIEERKKIIFNSINENLNIHLRLSLGQILITS